MQVGSEEVAANHIVRFGHPDIVGLVDGPEVVVAIDFHKSVCFARGFLIMAATICRLFVQFLNTGVIVPLLVHDGGENVSHFGE